MGVFLRWGVFGILAVAAMVYAYNASKRMAEHRQAQAVTAPEPQSDEAEEEADEEDSAPVAEAEGDSVETEEPEVSPVCREEQEVAERALKMRRDGEPLDRLLRIHLISFQSDPSRRERLEAVARKWFQREGRDPDGVALRREALRDCQSATRAP
jgi:hypothetical protein